MFKLDLTTKTENKPANVEEAINAGWKTAKEMYETADVGERTWRRFMADVSNAMLKKQDSGCETTVIANLVVKLGSSHKAYYHPKVEEAFQLWLKKNAINAGGQRTEGSIIKQDNQQDLFIGCVATKGTPDEIRSLAQHLQNFANQKELLEQTKQQNQQLQLENYNLSEENNYLKKLSNFQSTQLDYYTKKYHSWYDNYENY